MSTHQLVDDTGRSIGVVVACTEAEIEGSWWEPPPKYALDGTCAHPDVDPLKCCRFCGEEM